MFFEKCDDYSGKTNYNAPIPARHKHLLIPGFSQRYVSGDWGAYLSQWLETEVLTFWIHHFFMLMKCAMLARTPETIYTLHHLHHGRVYGTLNGSRPVELSSDWSHFFIIPANMEQQVIFEAGTVISTHTDFKRHYLDRNLQHYKILQPLLQLYDANTDQALHERSVIHDHLLEHPWRTTLDVLASASNPVLYLEAHGRELLRMHYERLEETISFLENDIDPALVSPEQLKKIREARLLMEKDVSLPHSIASLSKKVNLNRFDLKRSFREVYKTSIHQYLVELRMRHARELILTTLLNNGEIAERCGIPNIPYFCTSFKKHFGLTPKEMRISKGVKSID